LARGAAVQAQNFNALTRSDSNLPRAVGCTSYNFAILAAHPKTGSLQPRILLEKASELPAAVNRTLRPSTLSGADGQYFPSLQIIESTGMGDNNWLRLGKVKPDALFPERGPTDPLQLRLEVDASGILETSLVWPAGNRQYRLPESSDPVLKELNRWHGWLDATLLGNGI
jgi:hypothetical protein